jgi:hypothetical protein
LLRYPGEKNERDLQVQNQANSAWANPVGTLHSTSRNFVIARPFYPVCFCINSLASDCGGAMKLGHAVNCFPIVTTKP